MQLAGITTVAGFARRVGAPASLVGNWLTGERRPGPEYIKKLSRQFGESAENIARMAGIIPGDVQSEELSLDERLERAEFELRAVRMRLAQEKADQVRSTRLLPAVRRPVGGVASGGPGSFQDDYTHIPPAQADETKQILYVVGNCMAPRIEPGDAVIVDMEGSPREGRIVVAQRGEQIVVKRYYGDELRGDDGSVLPLAGWDVVGVVIGTIKPEE